MLPKPVNPTTAILTFELPPKSRPQKDWLYNTGGKPHEPSTDPLAAEVVALWRPAQTIVCEPMRPGWAGLASYRLITGDGNKHLKIAMSQPAEKQDAYKKLCANTVGEAARASWAGQSGLGPKIDYVNADLGAFVADFVEGRAPTFEESRSSLLSMHLQTLASIHSQNAATVPSGGHDNWLLEDWMNVGAQLAGSKQPRPKALQEAFVQLEKGLQSYLRRQSDFKAVPIHNDYKPDNIIYNGERMVVLDWNNLIVANPAIDLGHFACMVDFAAADMHEAIIKPYEKALQVAGKDSGISSQLLGATQAYTSLYRARNAAFYDQWEGSRAKADYLRHQLADDVLVLNDIVFKEIDLRPNFNKI